MKIVIADDSATMRRIVTTVLEKDGHEVVQAEDGLSAVQAVFATQQDVVVMDVQMPRLSGYIAARLLREDWATADIPIVLLTSLDAAADRYWGGMSGAARYLTKDFEPGELSACVADVAADAEKARGGRDRLRPDVVELSDDDVLEKTCDVLDRTLFQTSVAGEVTALAATVHGFEQTVAALLDVVGRVVDHHLAGVVLLEERSAYLAVGHEVSQRHYADFISRAAEVVAQTGGVDFPVGALEARVVDPEGRLGADDEADLATFLSMPLRGHGGQLVGVLALSSSFEDAFGDSSLTTLRLIEGPAALVVDNARLSSRQGAAAR